MGVVIGVDPHKASVTIEVRDEREILRATGQFATSRSGYRQLLAYVRQWPERIWAVEGANGVGRPHPPGKCSRARTDSTFDKSNRSRSGAPSRQRHRLAITDP